MCSIVTIDRMRRKCAPTQMILYQGFVGWDTIFFFQNSFYWSLDKEFPPYIYMHVYMHMPAVMH